MPCTAVAMALLLLELQLQASMMLVANLGEPKHIITTTACACEWGGLQCAAPQQTPGNTVTSSAIWTKRQVAHLTGGKK